MATQTQLTRAQRDILDFVVALEDKGFLDFDTPNVEQGLLLQRLDAALKASEMSKEDQVYHLNARSSTASTKYTNAANKYEAKVAADSSYLTQILNTGKSIFNWASESDVPTTLENAEATEALLENAEVSPTPTPSPSPSSPSPSPTPASGCANEHIETMSTTQANYTASTNADTYTKFYFSGETGAQFKDDYFNITGGTCENDLIVIKNLPASGRLASSTGVENVGVQATSAATFDMSTMSGVKMISNERSSEALTFDGITYASGMVFDVESSENKETTFKLVGSSLSADDDAVTLKVKKSGGDGITISSDDTSAVLETINLETYGSASTLADLTTTDVNTTKLNITGAQDLTITAALDTDIVNVDGSAATGALTFEMDATLAGYDVKTGSDDDVVTVSKLNSTSSIDLGAGTDTLVLKGAASLSDASTNFNTVASGVEKLDLNSITTPGAIDASKFTGVTHYVLKDGWGSNHLTKLATGTDLDFKGTATTANITMDPDAAAPTSGYSLTMSVIDTFTGANVITAPTAAGTHTIKVTSAGTAAYPLTPAITNFDEVTLHADQANSAHATTLDSGLLVNAKKFTVTGDSSITATAAIADGVLDTLDASANTGGITMGASTLAASTTGQNITVKGSATAANTLYGTSGNDVIYSGAAGDTISSLAGLDYIHLTGTNQHTIVKSSVTDSTNRNIISGFKAGASQDIFELNTTGGTREDQFETLITGTETTYTVAADTTAGDLHVVKITGAGKTIPDVTSPNSLDGTNLLLAMGDNDAAPATFNVAATSDEVAVAVGITGGGTAIYYCLSTDNTSVVAGECTLEGVLENVAVGDLTIDNFAAS